MYEEAEKWMKAVGKRKFMGGSAPNLADLVKDFALITVTIQTLFTARSSVLIHLSFHSVNTSNRPSVLLFSGSVWRIERIGRTRCISRSYDAHNNEAMVRSGQTSRADTCWRKQFLTSQFDHENRYIALAEIKQLLITQRQQDLKWSFEMNGRSSGRVRQA